MWYIYCKRLALELTESDWSDILLGLNFLFWLSLSRLSIFLDATTRSGNSFTDRHIDRTRNTFGMAIALLGTLINACNGSTPYSYKSRDAAPVFNPIKRRRADDFSDAQNVKRAKASVNPSSQGKAMPPTRTLLLDTANTLSTQEYEAQHISASSTTFTARDGAEYRIALRKASELTGLESAQCLDILKETSMPDYKASEHGWNEENKLKEMAEKDMRYLLVRRKASGVEEAETTQAEDASPREADIVAFMSTMLTTEDDHAVVYVYEVHLTAPARGTGLGKHLMQMQESIGGSVGVEKSMLTVFTRNSHAMDFYRQLGYTHDEISPADKVLRRGRIRKPEYYILSKILQRR